jgi:pyridoxal phosphate enzyme (YggS family)
MTETVERLKAVRERIAHAARASGRDPSEVRLIAVSKGQGVDQIRQAYEAGQRDFGENYVQELTVKARMLADLTELRWHMIGHVQTNKAKRVVEVAFMVQTVDSVRVAQALGRRAQEAGRQLPVLLEVNVGKETSKTGVAIEQARQVLDAIEQQASLRAVGLMTVPPFEADAAEAGRYFEALVKLRDELGARQRLPELSMGMSHDFEVAIAKGATMVRIGTAIFGERRGVQHF